MAQTGENQLEIQTKKMVDLVKEYQDVFTREFRDLKGLVV